MSNLDPVLLADDYARLWRTMSIVPARLGIADAAARRLIKDRPRYAAVSAATAAPAALIMVIHERESGGRFDRHLHNGDPLTARTVHVPAGRPEEGAPPFTWEESAADALRCQKLDGIAPADWTIARACLALESYNGFGYRRRGLRSPYLWAGTNHQQPGKYVADGRFDPAATDRQLGACAVLARLIALDPGLAFDPALSPASEASPTKAPSRQPGGATGSLPADGTPSSPPGGHAAAPLAALAALAFAAAAAFTGSFAHLRGMAAAFLSSFWN
jgi:lysozyme family protein